MKKVQEINTATLPNHVAIIMDGNGRWAKQKGLLRAIGHENGTKSVRVTVESCAKLGIKNLTLYAFSTENWNRPKIEVETLMRLLISSLKQEIKTLQSNNIKLNMFTFVLCLTSDPQTYHKKLANAFMKSGSESMD